MGTRFYKLFTECFQTWAIMYEKGEVTQSFEELNAAGVLMLDDVVYYEADASHLMQQHRVLDRLLSENEVKIAGQGEFNQNNAGQNVGYGSDIYVSPSPPKLNVMGLTNRTNGQYYDQTNRNRLKKE